jgi:HD-GYP domain-containing protein (c-di-GMP phosphodiesterase class II)
MRRSWLLPMLVCAMLLGCRSPEPPARSLDKPSRLSDEELRIMRQHAGVGVSILEPITAYRDVIPIVGQHHEWFDGNGYPQGLAGEAISLGARIFSVADVYDALRSDRPYRVGQDREKVIAYIHERSGTQFDPRVVAAFLRVMGEAGRPDAAAAPAASA